MKPRPSLIIQRAYSSIWELHFTLYTTVLRYLRIVANLEYNPIANRPILIFTCSHVSALPRGTASISDSAIHWPVVDLGRAVVPRHSYYDAAWANKLSVNGDDRDDQQPIKHRPLQRMFLRSQGLCCVGACELVLWCSEAPFGASSHPDLEYHPNLAEIVPCPITHIFPSFPGLEIFFSLTTILWP